tara:strand:- start:46 stop:639 length:594 start_codon:yes stop_codon:yes gene_type:complete
MDKAKKELKQKLVDKFNIDFTHPEYLGADKQLCYALLKESEDEYEGSQKECDSLKLTIKDLRGFNDNQMNQIKTLKEDHDHDIKTLEEIIEGLKCTNNDLEAELVKVRSQCDKLKADNNENESLLKIADQEIKVLKSVRKIPLLGTDTLSYQSDFILRWKEHLKEWNDLVSDFQNKYLPVLKEAINSFILRVKNVEL